MKSNTVIILLLIITALVSCVEDYAPEPKKNFTFNVESDGRKYDAVISWSVNSRYNYSDKVNTVSYSSGFTVKPGDVFTISIESTTPLTLTVLIDGEIERSVVLNPGQPYSVEL